MIKKKLFLAVLIGACLMGFTGCMSAQEEAPQEEESLVTAKEITEYKGLIEDLFNSFYWYYDDETVEFVEAEVPDDKTAFGKAALEASADAGYKLSRYSGDEMVCAAVNLEHYNGNGAGTAYVYIDNGKVVGVYYSPLYSTDIAYSLNDRNVFTAKADFTAFESNMPMQEFSSREVNFLKSGFSSSGDNGYGNFMAAVHDEDTANVYTLWGSSVSAMPLSYGSDTVVIDVAVSSKSDGSNLIAVILGRKNATGDDAENHMMISEKIELLDKNGGLVGEITGDDKGYSFVGFDKGYVVVGQDGFIDYYKGTAKEKSVYAGIEVTDMKRCDFDGDGIDEYVVTDGLDLYICRIEDESLDILWRTNISTRFFDGNVYLGDLNGDGVREIYLVDTNGCGIKYTLTEKGFKYNTVGENGEVYFVADFDLDGKSDYLEATNEISLPAVLNIAK